MDALSHALTAVRMTGAIFYHAECTAPWGFAVPALKQVAHVLAPGTERLVPYHLVTEGRAVVRFDGAEVALTAGDVLIIPHGDAHSVTNDSPAELVDSAASLGEYLSGDLRTMRVGTGGERTAFICGYFGCERHADRLFLAGLPQWIKINVRGDSAGAWVENSIQSRDGVCSLPPGCCRQAGRALWILRWKSGTSPRPLSIGHSNGNLAFLRRNTAGRSLSRAHLRCALCLERFAGNHSVNLGDPLSGDMPARSLPHRRVAAAM
jgi:hypothetical protein